MLQMYTQIYIIYSTDPVRSVHSPVVAKVLLLNVADVERVAVAPGVHDASVGALDRKWVLVPGHLQGEDDEEHVNWVQQQMQLINSTEIWPTCRQSVSQPVGKFFLSQCETKWNKMKVGQIKMALICHSKKSEKEIAGTKHEKTRQAQHNTVQYNRTERLKQDKTEKDLENWINWIWKNKE